jgi:hypothetical protein
MEVRLGDKLFLKVKDEYGVVGFLVDVSPNKKMIYISRFNLEEWQEATKSFDAKPDGHWYELSELTLLDVLPESSASGPNRFNFVLTE